MCKIAQGKELTSLISIMNWSELVRSHGEGAWLDKEFEAKLEKFEDLTLNMSSRYVACNNMDVLSLNFYLLRVAINVSCSYKMRKHNSWKKTSSIV